MMLLSEGQCTYYLPSLMSLRQLATTAVHPVWWLRKTNFKKHLYVC